MTRWLATIALLCAILTAARAGDLVNERLTASTAAREAHWDVDCSATLSALHGAAEDSAEIEQALSKCRFIHQPPGVAGVVKCPDYEAILVAYRSRDTERLQQALRQARRCQPPPARGEPTP